MARQQDRINRQSFNACHAPLHIMYLARALYAHCWLPRSLACLTPLRPLKLTSSLNRSNQGTSADSRSQLSIQKVSSNATVNASRNGLGDVRGSSDSVNSHYSSQTRHRLTVDPRFHSNTGPESSSSRLTRQALTEHQGQMSRFHNEPGAASAARGAQEAHTVMAGRSLGVTLSASSAKSFDGMTPLERHAAEKEHRKGAWSPATSRR